MMLQSYLLRIPSFLLVIFSLHTLADLNSEKQALLDFAAAVHHGQKINWNSDTSICTCWVGITCSPNGSHVLALRLPGIGLRGSLPANTISKLHGLMILSLRSNSPSRNLPNDILSHRSLRFIYLQFNNFSGDIPHSLSPQLDFLDLSYNSSTGKIPALFQNLPYLTGLKLQNNSLSGPIPDLNLPKLKTPEIEPQLKRFNSFSPLEISFLFISRESQVMWTTCIPMFFSFPILRAVSTNGLVRTKRSLQREAEYRFKEDFGSGVQEPEKNKLISFEGCSYSFDLEDLLRASAKVLGKGSCGTTYKAIWEEGTAVVVKRLKEVVVGKKEFEQQMETVQIRAYYYSKDEKLLVYDYIAVGSLSNLLHGTNGAGRTPLDSESD